MGCLSLVAIMAIRGADVALDYRTRQSIRVSFLAISCTLVFSPGEDFKNYTIVAVDIEEKRCADGKKQQEDQCGRDMFISASLFLSFRSLAKWISDFTVMTSRAYKAWYGLYLVAILRCPRERGL